MKNTSLKIVSRHTSLLEAVRAAGLDLSYNEAEALRDINALENGHRNFKPVREAFVVVADRTPASYDITNAEGKPVEVWYRLDCDLRLLNKYTPFISCMHDGPWSAAIIKESTIEFVGSFPGAMDRKALAATGWIFAK